MPSFATTPPPYKPRREIKKNWDNFRKGLNLLLRPTELGNNELAQADNTMLKGSGTVTGRWGTSLYFTANATGSVRGIGTYVQGAYNDLFALTDEGYLAKKNGSSYTRITGQSWPSGSTIRTAQLGAETYLVSEDAAFTKYSGTNLSVLATISAPTGLSATNFSGATGPDRQSYRIVALGPNGGSTTPSTNYVLTGLPNPLSRTQIKLFWTAPSAASLGGYEVYRGREGDETWLASVDAAQTTYIDNGEAASEVIEAPLTNTTGGVKSPFIKKYKDRIICVDGTNRSKLLISARYPDQTKFNWADGGGYIYIDPDSGDDITGIEVQPIADKLVVYKNFASYLVELSTITIGNYVVLDPQYQPISTAVGCSNQDTIATVENDTFYFGRDGIYVTGYEPNFLNIIRTNEISARIRPEFSGLNQSDYDNANAAYFDNKYILSLPTRKTLYVYDRERGAFAGKWSMPFGISHMMKYVDTTGTEKWVIGSYDDNKIYTFEESVNTDNGVAISKTIRTNKEYFDDWTLLNILRFFYVLFNNVTGEVTVNIIAEDRAGNVSTIKSFTITGAETAGRSGWGASLWGEAMWGSTEGTPVVAGTELTRWGSLFKQARLVQIEISSTSAGSNFELLSIQMSATKQSSGSLSSAQRV